LEHQCAAAKKNTQELAIATHARRLSPSGKDASIYWFCGLDEGLEASLRLKNKNRIELASFEVFERAMLIE
jgi:hypothetical protein